MKINEILTEAMYSHKGIISFCAGNCDLSVCIITFDIIIVAISSNQRGIKPLIFLIEKQNNLDRIHSIKT